MASITPGGSGWEILGEGHDPTLAPDGKLICYTGHEVGGVTGFVMNHDGTHKREVVKKISKVGATFPQLVAGLGVARLFLPCRRRA